MALPEWLAYQKCYSHEPARHMVKYPTSQEVAELKQRGIEPISDELIMVPDEPCPGCIEDRRDYLRSNMRLADDVGDEEAAREYARELAQLT